MQVRRLIKSVAPPIVLDYYRSLRDGNHRGYIWKGIYPHYSDVPIAGPGFEGDIWVEKAARLAEMLWAWSQKAASIPHGVTGRHALLPFLTASVWHAGEGLTILDIGGGMGIDYLHLRGAVGPGPALEYHIVESKRICEGGSRLFADDGGVHFHTTLPVGLEEVDIAYVGNTLQFVEDYAGLLHALCAYHPRYILLVNLAAGDIPTYAAAQRNVRGSLIAAWFFSVTEIVELLSHAGYSLRYKGASDEEWNQDNYPAAYRLGRPCHLLFARI